MFRIVDCFKKNFNSVGTLLLINAIRRSSIAGFVFYVLSSKAFRFVKIRASRFHIMQGFFYPLQSST